MNVLPASFNNGTYSYLEGAKLQTRPKLTLSNIKKGTFQTQTEKWLTTKVPKRDSVMLLNAKVQRGIIKTANLACGFETIPTFFGSKYSYSEELDAVFETSQQQSNELSRNFEESAQIINNFAEQHENLNFVIAIPDLIWDSEANPSYSLTSQPVNNSYREDHFFSQLNSRIHYVDLSCSDSAEHFKKYFRADHHWNVEGAYDAYIKIMTSAFPNLDILNVRKDEIGTYDEPAFFGSKARSGLHLVSFPDQISDFMTDWEGISIEINGKLASPQDIEAVEKYTKGTYERNMFVDRYSEYFGSNVATSTFSKNNNTNRNLLVISDSYLNSCAHFYVHSFDKVVTVNQEMFEGSLCELIEKNNITDVLFEQNDHRYSLSKQVPLLKKLLES